MGSRRATRGKRMMTKKEMREDISQYHLQMLKNASNGRIDLLPVESKRTVRLVKQCTARQVESQIAKGGRMPTNRTAISQIM